jgi:hypothetical protein
VRPILEEKREGNEHGRSLFMFLEDGFALRVDEKEEKSKLEEKLIDAYSDLK